MEEKNWCRGKVGHEHRYKWEYNPSSWGSKTEISSRDLGYICQNCGRKEHSSSFNALVTLIALSVGVKDARSGVSILLRLLNKKIKLEDII